MRLALIADIHANADALQAVLADLPAVDRVICCGDLVGYYDQPNEVCALVRAQGIECIRGNHDAYVTGHLTPKPANRLAYRTDWTHEVLAAEHLQWLDALGQTLHVEADGQRLTIRHASPWDEETYLYPDADEALSKLRIMPDETLVVGHTHRPLHRRVSDGWLLNPGSVGQPRDYDPMACYAVVDLAAGMVQHRRVSYDVTGVQARLTRQSWDAGVIGILSRTHSK